MKQRGAFTQSLERTWIIVNLMMQYVDLTAPVACPKACSCGTVFGEKPYVRCSNLQSQDLYKVMTNIPESTEEIKMTNTLLTQLHQLQGNFPNLHYLSIKNCSMLNLKDALQSFLSTNEKIYSISVTFNDIMMVQGNPFQSLVTLQQLDLCHNRILQIDDSVFSASPNLQILKLCHNRLISLETSLFASNAELTSLFLENNDFEIFPLEALKILKKLQHLDLSSNKINKIPSLSELPSLKYLYLSDNRIRIIEQHAFDDLPYLSVLWLSRNKITALPEDMALKFHLMDFDRIILNDNPFTCDCRNKWLISWQKDKCDQNNKSRGCYLTCSEQGASIPMRKADIDNWKCDCGSRCYCRTGTEKACEVNCHRGSASSEAQSQKCSQCPIGSLSLFNGASTCQCRAGYSIENGVCTKCPGGTYKSIIGPTTCIPCPQYSTSHNGSTAPEHCICHHGEFSILSDERQCQRYENEEYVRLGIDPGVLTEERPSKKSIALPGLEPSVTTTPAKTDQLTDYRHTTRRSDNVIFGVVGVVVSVFLAGVGFALYKWKQNNQTDFGLPQKLVLHSTCQNEERHGSLIYSTKLENYYKGLEVASNQLKIGKLIGRGAFGRVYEGFLHSTKDKDMKVAIKRLKEDATREENEALQMEAEHMMYVGKHPNIIQLLGVCSIKGSLMLVLEYASNGDLLSYLRRYSTLPSLQLTVPGFGNERSAVEIFRTLIMFTWQVSKGMCHLEKLKCIHRDLAARNILLTLDPIAKISDFGLSRDVYESAYYFKVSKGRLPFKWMSPEALLMGQYSIKSDVWSFGILLWEVVTLGGNPYAGIPVEALCELYANNYRLPKPASCPNPIYRLMQDCWGELTNDRPSFYDVEARLDNLLQYVANREYTDLMEKENAPVSVDNCATDATRYMTMSSFYDTDSDDRTYEETSDSDTYQEADLNSDLLPCRPIRTHLSQQKSSQWYTEESNPEAEVVSNPVTNDVCKLPKSASAIELQNLCDYKVKMWSNPIYGSSRQ